MSSVSTETARQTVLSLLEDFAVRQAARGNKTRVTGVDADSRRLRPGELFLAEASADGKRHGLDHVESALARGASAVAWEPGTRAPPELHSVPSFEVPELSRYTSEIAARFYNHPSRGLFVVGITGTDGKTSCCHLLSQALEIAGERCAALGTLGYGFPGRLAHASHTTPDAVAVQRWLHAFHIAGAHSVAMEVSSHALDQHRPDAVDFDVAVLTNIKRDHLDYHGDEKAYRKAKRRLFEFSGLGAVVLNADDDSGARWLQELPDTVFRIAYGVGRTRALNASAYVVADSIRSLPEGIQLEINTSWGRGVLSSRLLGRFNAYNLLAVAAVLLQRGMALDEALQALGQVPTVPGRMEGYKKTDTPLIVVDYAHTPSALSQALAGLREHCRGNLWVVFGCGGERDQGKRPLMAREAAALADHIVVTDDNPRREAPEAITRDIVAGFPTGAGYRVVHDRGEAVRGAAMSAHPEDIVLVAGKGHETEQIVGSERRPFSDRELAARLVEGEGG